MVTTTLGTARDLGMLLDEAVFQRHSSRRFQATPVPTDKLLSALSLATHAPSNSNIQPWRIYLVTGPALDRLNSALVAAAASEETPLIPPLPQKFAPLRSEMGRQVYGEGLGIPKEDAAGRKAAVLRNFDFFGAPVAAIVCMDQNLSSADTLSVGMYLQTFLLGLTEHGIGSCVEVSVTGYPEVIRKIVGIPGEQEILVGVAIGYEQVGLKVNQIQARRVSIGETVTFLDA